MTRCAGWLSTEPASVLHRFVSLASEPDYLALGRMRERPLRPGVEKHLGVWLIEFIDANGGGPGVRLRDSR
jgi:hypothetical protein